MWAQFLHEWGLWTNNKKEKEENQPICFLCFLKHARVKKLTTSVKQNAMSSRMPRRLWRDACILKSIFHQVASYHLFCHSNRKSNLIYHYFFYYSFNRSSLLTFSLVKHFNIYFLMIILTILAYIHIKVTTCLREIFASCGPDCVIYNNKDDYVIVT
jgi:hypothetical protein